ncbi:hypothetical protein PFISCL1PPCAC_12776, partial [Pristionchus fissidentatus]
WTESSSATTRLPSRHLHRESARRQSIQMISLCQRTCMQKRRGTGWSQSAPQIQHTNVCPRPAERSKTCRRRRRRLTRRAHGK